MTSPTTVQDGARSSATPAARAPARQRRRPAAPTSAPASRRGRGRGRRTPRATASSPGCTHTVHALRARGVELVGERGQRRDQRRAGAGVVDHRVDERALRPRRAVRDEQAVVALDDARARRGAVEQPVERPVRRADGARASPRAFTIPTALHLGASGSALRSNASLCCASSVPASGYSPEKQASQWRPRSPRTAS